MGFAPRAAPGRYFRRTVLSLSRRLASSRRSRNTSCWDLWRCRSSILLPVGNAAPQLTYTFLTNKAEEGTCTVGQQRRRLSEGLEGTQTMRAGSCTNPPTRPAQHQEPPAPRLANARTGEDKAHS